MALSSPQIYAPSRARLGLAAMALLVAGLLFGLGVALFARPPQGFRYIDEDMILVGYEGTYQTPRMANHRGPTDHETPEKLRYYPKFLNALKAEIARPSRYIENTIGSGLISKTPKHRERFETDQVGIYEDILLTLEPGCIEVNRDPRVASKLRVAWRPIYKAAHAVGLTHAVYPVGQLGGGGQFHVGSAKYVDNPMYKHPIALAQLASFFSQTPGADVWLF